MTLYEPGDVVLVHFPFTDFSSVKRRPAVVVSPPEYWTLYGDLIFLALTSSNLDNVSHQLFNWREAGLAKPTWIKPVLATIAIELIHERLGRISERDRGQVSDSLSLVISKDLR
jgi:mRNA interferase MazF